MVLPRNTSFGRLSVGETFTLAGHEGPHATVYWKRDDSVGLATGPAGVVDPKARFSFAKDQKVWRVGGENV